MCKFDGLDQRSAHLLVDIFRYSKMQSMIKFYWECCHRKLSRQLLKYTDVYVV